MVVCESGTGSGALSHAILRSIAPRGKLHTFEFNESRAIKAKEEFEKNGVTHLVEVRHVDVCGKDSDNGGSGGGFGLGGQRAHAVMLDLPEPWLAVPHAAHVLKRGGRIASYSPCMEQAQRCIAAMNHKGFHSIRTLEFRLREHYVDEVELWPPPKEKRPRLELNDQHHLSYVQPIDANGNDESDTPVNNDTTKTESRNKMEARKMICTRPFNNMRGHTAFLTFATAGNILQPDPCAVAVEKASS
ncbi:tRNA methyltransferase complex GCD14 subunit [Fragilaria crotonensis]|nr:tRNA methyltransferase complex GCD14 subunit [Fragilaria crotonensis]